MSTGFCRHCGYRPVAKNAWVCPECGGDHPHPSASRWGSFLAVLAIAIVILMVLPWWFGKTKPRPHFRTLIESSYVIASTTTERVASYHSVAT
jgi:uncharacterized protein (DUF983 family)